MKPAIAIVWKSLARAADAARDLPLRDMFAADPRRFARLSVTWNDWLLDYSKQRVSSATMDQLHGLWQAAEVPAWIARMRGGETVNHSEGRAALHIALRRPLDKGPLMQGGKDVMPAVRAELAKMQGFVGQVHSRH